MNKQETYDYLTKHGIKFEKTEHRAVFSMNEVDAVELPYPDRDAKNLFVRDDKNKMTKTFYEIFLMRIMTILSLLNIKMCICNISNMLPVL